MANSLRSFSRDDSPAVLELSRRAFSRPEEQVGNPLWASLDELESELSDWDHPPEETLLVDEEDGQVVGFGGVEVANGFPHADLFGPMIAPGYRGQKLGSELLDASVAIAVEHGRHTIVGSVGPRNISGRMLLEHKGFHPRGPAKAVFRLAPEEHRAAERGPRGRRGAARRRGATSSARSRSTTTTFPEGLFPDEAWRDGLAKGSVYLAERGRPAARVPQHRPERPLGLPDRRRRQRSARAASGTSSSRACSRTTGAAIRARSSASRSRPTTFPR